VAQDEPLIAIVDDDESVREAALSLFASMGLSAIAFACAEEFLNSGCVGRASCLVLDVQMPGMGGLRLQSHLSAAGRQIPILFITAYQDEAVRKTACEAGALMFLHKPFSEADLLDGLRSALTAAQQRPYTDSTTRK
jgi:FixJ family two-component response regulator